MTNYIGSGPPLVTEFVTCSWWCLTTVCDSFMTRVHLCLVMVCESLVTRRFGSLTTVYDTLVTIRTGNYMYMYTRHFSRKFTLKNKHLRETPVKITSVFLHMKFTKTCIQKIPTQFSNLMNIIKNTNFWDGGRGMVQFARVQRISSYMGEIHVTWQFLQYKLQYLLSLDHCLW